jgi:hypothetical protein
MVVATRAQKRGLRAELRHEAEAERVSVERDLTASAMQA